MFLLTNHKAAAMVITFMACCVPLAAGPALPDLVVLLNGNVITLNAKQPSAEAIAIQGERIVWIGSSAEARSRFHDNSHALDLHKATVLPGIIDAHGHLLALGQSLLRLNLKDVTTEKEAVARVKEKIASAPSGEWIQGWGWDEGKWASHYPSNQELTEISPQNPVYLVGLHGFASWANKRALELAGISKETHDPENGKIVRDEKTGEPTGILLNHAQELVARHIPPLTLDQAKKAIELAAQECLRQGLTEVHDAQVSPLMLSAIRALLQESHLPLRVYVMLDAANKPLVEEWLRRRPEIDPRPRPSVRALQWV